MKKSSEIIFYKNQNGENQIDVRLENETIWLTQEQISSLFEVDRTVITKHLKNIFASQELDEKSNVQKMHIAGSDKPVKFYNLDGIISVGYRVNSKRATQFRIWATSILKIISSKVLPLIKSVSVKSASQNSKKQSLW